MKKKNKDQFSLELGEKARDEGIERAHKAADPAWLREAETVLKDVARQNSAFTTDLLWMKGLSEVSEPRALGGVMRKMAREGIITATSGFVPTLRVSRHRAPVRVWQSNIFGQS